MSPTTGKRPDGGRSAARSAKVQKPKSSKVPQTLTKKKRRTEGSSSAGPTRRRAGPPRGKRGVGLAAGLWVCEAHGDGVELVEVEKHELDRTVKSPAGADALLANAGRAMGRGVRWGDVAEGLAAAGNAHRLRLLAHLLEGPATYRALLKATKLQAGPLYHHIDKLRLAGLMAPRARDVYALTRAGRNVILAAIVLAPMLRDRRLRPQPGARREAGERRTKRS